MTRAVGMTFAKISSLSVFKLLLMNCSNPETVTVNDSVHGLGIFSAVNLSKGDFILKIKGTPINFSQTLHLGTHECYCLQLAKNKYIIPQYPFYLSNHSCNPNCGINKELELFALKDISAGEELYWDYSTSMLERHWVMNCNCGEENCRKIIQDFDLLPSYIMDKYIRLGIVMPFIVEYLSGLGTKSHLNSKNYIS